MEPDESHQRGWGWRGAGGGVAEWGTVQEERVFRVGHLHQVLPDDVRLEGQAVGYPGCT